MLNGTIFCSTNVLAKVKRFVLENLRNCVSSLLTVPDYNTVNLPSRNCHKCFLGSAFIIPSIMAAVFFPNINLVKLIIITCLF